MATEELTRDSKFSYACGRCMKCCNGRRVYLNPYEVTRLAENKGISTGVFIENFVDEKDFKLKHQPNGDCTLLNEHGCSVYKDRPLACRLYPLARKREGTGEERFAKINPEPETKGTYGTNGTVEDYLDTQLTETFERFADEYFKVFSQMAACSSQGAITTQLIYDVVLSHVPLQQRLMLDLNRNKEFSRFLSIDESLPYDSASQVGTPEERAELHLEMLRKNSSSL